MRRKLFVVKCLACKHVFKRTFWAANEREVWQDQELRGLTNDHDIEIHPQDAPARFVLTQYVPRKATRGKRG